MKEAIFISFAVLTIAFALGVVFSRNPIYAAFNLVLCFFGLSGVYVLWGANFIAMIQVLIYTGAIVVLFLFVVMLLDLVRAPQAPAPGWLTVLLSGVATWFFSLLLLRTLNRATLFVATPTAEAGSLRNIARLLFTDYLWPFEVLSFFLLALMIAVYVLTRPETKTEKGKP